MPSGAIRGDTAAVERVGLPKCVLLLLLVSGHEDVMEALETEDSIHDQ